MKLNGMLAKVGTGLSKASFKLKKASPELLVIGGVLGVIASGVMACVATTKISQVTEEHKEKTEKIHKAAKDGYIMTKNGKEDYTEQDKEKDLTITYAQTAWGYIKLYAPAAGLMALSLASVLASHQILRKRNAALAAAYTAVDKAFKNYRKGVVDKFGETVDKELRYGVKAVDTSDTTGDQEEKKTVQTVSGDLGYSPYAKIFDELNPNFQRNPEFGMIFIRGQIEMLNRMLRSRGYLFLNEAYAAFGFEPIKEGQVIGWLYRPNGGKEFQNAVDFGFYTKHKTDVNRFINGYEPCVVLDFNPDGYIYDEFVK